MLYHTIPETLQKCLYVHCLGWWGQVEPECSILVRQAKFTEAIYMPDVQQLLLGNTACYHFPFTIHFSEGFNDSMIIEKKKNINRFSPLNEKGDVSQFFFKPLKHESSLGNTFIIQIIWSLSPIHMLRQLGLYRNKKKKTLNKSLSFNDHQSLVTWRWKQQWAK